MHSTIPVADLPAAVLQTTDSWEPAALRGCENRAPRRLGPTARICLATQASRLLLTREPLVVNVPIRSSSLTPDWRSLPPGSGCDKGNCGTGAEAPGGRLSWNFLPAKFGAQIVEFKPQEVVGGVPQRPKRGLAFESGGMRSMLNDLGFDATRCQAPVVRMHTKLRGGFQSTAWVYARCSLR